jgi:hypothetical protein
VALGVVAEEVVLGGEVVARALAGALVEDLEPAVVAEVGGGVDEVAEAEGEVVGGVDDAVDEVVVAGLAVVAQGGVEGGKSWKRR